MHVLIATDRLSLRGGADQHLLDIIAALVGAGVSVSVACGRPDARLLPDGVAVTPVRALSRMVAGSRQLDRLTPLIAAADVVHVQNVMNPTALQRLVGSGKAVVTVQDHRVFCPGPGKTLPSGRACEAAMSAAACADCLPGADYRDEMLALTAQRQAALDGARLVVLSRYMAGELAEAGLPGAAVIPPWVDPPAVPASAASVLAGDAFFMGGRLVVHKGFDVALRAWRAAGAPLPLRVAGAGPVVLDGVEALDWLDRPALLATMAASRAVIFPTRWQEPFGILGLQALSVGTPVVVMPAGGTADWSEAGCIAAADEAALAAALRRLAADPEHATALGEAGQAAVLARFQQAPLMAALLAEYEAAACG